MVKKLSYLCFKALVFLDKIFNTITKRSVLIYFNDFIQDSAYKSINILDKEIKFFVPNQLLNWRVDTFFTKEPETLEWIDNFEKKENLIFWDIGANIGLYSIYNSLKNPKSTTIAFEPSSSNLRVLTRNISINNLEKKIKVIPIPLTNKKNIFQEMKEGQFIEGGAMNSFGEKFDFEGKEFQTTMNYNLLGTTMNYFLENSILEIPDYIKIDVDGIEHLILEGASNYLSHEKIKSILVEVNEKFTDQMNNINEILAKNNFKFLSSYQSSNNSSTKTLSTKNYIFTK